jgi:hypothetical protein
VPCNFSPIYYVAACDVPAYTCFASFYDLVLEFDVITKAKFGGIFLQVLFIFLEFPNN